jgi:tetratricopeptide (TPR) repeat protein
MELKQGQKAVNDFLVSLRGNAKSFRHNLNLGRALFTAERYTDARGQLTACEELAISAEELAQVYYYRALSSEALENRPAAIKDWQSLLALPEDSVQPAWLRQASMALTPTPTITATVTPSATPTFTPSSMPTKTATAVKTSTRTPLYPTSQTPTLISTSKP